MRKTPLPLNGLRAFEAAARHGSFSRAAEELGVTPAAVSHLVRELEARLGVGLFRRLNSGLRITELGAALLPDVSEGLAHLHIAVERLGPRVPRGKLTLSVLATFAISWLMPRLGAFRVQEPGANLLLLTHNNVVPDFARERVDFAILYGEGRWRGLHAQRLFNYELTPLCGAPYRERLRTPNDLLHLPLLWNLNTDYWERWTAAAGIKGRLAKGPCFDSTRVTIEAAINGLGVAIGSPTLFAEEIARGRLFQPFPMVLPNGRAYWLVRPEGRRLGGAAAAFQDWILKETGKFGEAASTGR